MKDHPIETEEDIDREHKRLDRKLRRLELRYLEKETRFLKAMDPEIRKDYLREMMDLRSKEFEYHDKPCQVCGKQPSRFWIYGDFPLRLCKHCKDLSVNDIEEFQKFLESLGKVLVEIYHHEGFTSLHFEKEENQ